MENCNCRTPYYRNRMPNNCQSINNSCQNFNNSCRKQHDECGHTRDGVDDMPLAMSYVPWQNWKETYETCKALSIGTIFPELNLPYLERSCSR